MALPLPGVNLMALLKQLSDALRADVIEVLSREALEELTEATLNVILGNIPLFAQTVAFFATPQARPA